jgi:putative transposase
MNWKPSKPTRQQLEERRLEVGRLLKEGQLSQSQIAARLGVSCPAVSQWAKRYRSGSARRLQHRVTTGRPSKLTPAQRRTLKQQLRKCALAGGFPTDRWTIERVATLIERSWAFAIIRTTSRACFVNWASLSAIFSLNAEIHSAGSG